MNGVVIYMASLNKVETCEDELVTGLPNKTGFLRDFWPKACLSITRTSHYLFTKKIKHPTLRKNKRHRVVPEKIEKTTRKQGVRSL